jgi:hypothetical protein
MPAMKQLFGASAVLGLVFAGMPAQAQAPAQDQGDRTIEQFACKDVLRDSGANRDVAIAFLHGYLLGKSGSSKFNVDKLRAQTDAFIDRCLDNPTEKAEQAMTTVRK